MYLLPIQILLPIIVFIDCDALSVLCVVTPMYLVLVCNSLQTPDRGTGYVWHPKVCVQKGGKVKYLTA